MKIILDTKYLRVSWWEWLPQPWLRVTVGIRHLRINVGKR